MQKNSNKLKYIKIPNVYEDVTTKLPNIILMEYIDGKTIQNIDKEDYDAYAKQGRVPFSCTHDKICCFEAEVLQCIFMNPKFWK